MQPQVVANKKMVIWPLVGLDFSFLFFTTKLCGVLVLDLYLPHPLPPPCPHLGHTPSFTHHLCHTQMCHTPSFAHNFVLHNFVTHTNNSSHTTFRSILHYLLCLSFLPRPAWILLVGRSWLVGLSGPLILGLLNRIILVFDVGRWENHGLFEIFYVPLWFSHFVVYYYSCTKQTKPLMVDYY